MMTEQQKIAALKYVARYPELKQLYEAALQDRRAAKQFGDTIARLNIPHTISGRELGEATMIGLGLED